jgi:hypothetical protein
VIGCGGSQCHTYGLNTWQLISCGTGGILGFQTGQGQGVYHCVNCYLGIPNMVWGPDKAAIGTTGIAKETVSLLLNCASATGNRVGPMSPRGGTPQ